jgi:hypothetical protein
VYRFGQGQSGIEQRHKFLRKVDERYARLFRLSPGAVRRQSDDVKSPLAELTPRVCFIGGDDGTYQHAVVGVQGFGAKFHD